MEMSLVIRRFCLSAAISFVAAFTLLCDTYAAPMRVVARDGYGRIVFDWPTPVLYTANIIAGQLVLQFDRSVTGNVQMAADGLGGYLDEGRISPDRRTVSFPLTNDFRMRAFTVGTAVVVDLFGEAPIDFSIPAENQSASTLLEEIQRPIVNTESIDPARAVMEQQKPAEAAKTMPLPAPASEQSPLQIVPTSDQVESATETAAVTVSASLRTPVPPPPRPQVIPSPAVQIEPAVSTQTSSVSMGVPMIASASSLEDMAPAGASSGEVSMIIRWEEPAAAAIFRRGGFLWAVFDRYQKLDVEALTRAGAPYVTYVEQLPYRNNTIIRMVTQPGLNPFMRREGLAWIIDFRALPMRPTRTLDIIAQFDRTEPNLFLPVTEAGRTVAIEDPEVGDSFMVVPVIPLGYGIFPERNYPNLEMPITAQGVVVVPNSDGVRAQASRIGINIDVEGGLAISQQDLTARDAMITFGSQEQLQRILNVGDWQIGREADFLTTKQTLQFALGDQREDVREEARYRLARFEFANGFIPEALAILDIMREDNPKITDTGPFRALRGASNFMMRRYDESLQDFNHYSLANEDDVGFWASLARMQENPSILEAETITKTGSSIGSYPRRIKIPLAIMAAEATIDAGDDFGAQGFLDLIREENPTPHEQTAIAYLDGKLRQKIGEIQLALEQFKAAEEGMSRLYKTLASRERMELEHQLGEITTLDLIESLEQLRHRWRGDDVELGILHRLSDLYIEQDNYGDALRTLKLAASYFRDDPSVEGVAGRMSEVFLELFLNGAADDLSPITAIALFDEFSDLLPPGNRGDDMIRLLADRLVSVDLLDQAAMLLERQVEFRLAGPEQVRVGGRLALVHLMNRQPEKALQVLQNTNSNQSTRELQASRRRLQARALTELRRPDEAIVLLGADMTPESKQLRAEIYWRSENWTAAANAIAEMAPEPDRGLILDDTNARLILNWATALTLAGDDRTVTRVRQRYLASMEATAFADAFDLITTPRERGLLDYRAVRQQIEQAEDFQSFLIEYEEMIGDDTLSSAIN